MMNKDIGKEAKITLGVPVLNPLAIGSPILAKEVRRFIDAKLTFGLVKKGDKYELWRQEGKGDYPVGDADYGSVIVDRPVKGFDCFLLYVAGIRVVGERFPQFEK